MSGDVSPALSVQSTDAPTESQWIASARASIDGRQEDGLQADVRDRLSDDVAAAMAAICAARSSSQLGRLPQFQVTPPVEDAGFAAGLPVGRYQIERLLGEGGFGLVFLARDVALDRQVALKIPRPELLTRRDLLDGIVGEARTAAALHHPNIVTVFETGKFGSLDYIASAYCEGGSLADRLRERGAPYSSQEAAGLVAELAGAVAYAHARGIIHRDLKPANVLFAAVNAHADGGDAAEPRIADFGLAKRLSHTGQTSDAQGPVGTPQYMAPEQLVGTGDDVCVQSDIYALGTILYELLTGRPPFADRTASTWKRSLLHEQPAEIPHAPDDLRAICHKCLAKKPEARYRTAHDLQADLQRFLGGYPVVARPRTACGRMLKRCRRHPLIAALSAACLVCCAAGAAGIALQWQRAEAERQSAISHAATAQRHLDEAQSAVVNLSWALEDSSFWREPYDRSGAKIRDELLAYYETALAGQDRDFKSAAIRAAAHAQLARKLADDGATAEAESHYRDSLAQWHAALDAAPQQRSLVRTATQVMYRFGDFLATNRHEPDGRYPLEGGRLFGEFALDTQVGRIVARDYAELLALKASSLGSRQLVLADGLHAACAAVCDLLAQVEPTEPVHRYRALSAGHQRARILWAHGQRDAALEALVSNGAAWRNFVADYPHSADYRLELGAVLLEIGNRRHEQRLPQLARGDYAEARTVFESVLAENAQDVRPRAQLGKLLLRMASYLADPASDEALCLYEGAREHFEALRRFGKLEHAMYEATARTHRFLARAYEQRHDAVAAIQAFQAAAADYAQGRQHGVERRQRRVLEANCHSAAARLLEASGRNAEALAAYRAACEILTGWRGRGQDDPQFAGELERLRSIIDRLAAQTSTTGPGSAMSAAQIPH